jgi:hypothetical protein
VPLTNALKGEYNVTIFMNMFSTDPILEKNHFSPVIKLLMVNKEDLYSMDDMGTSILWNLRGAGGVNTALLS